MTDIHTQTAAEIFCVPVESVTKEQRDYAKKRTHIRTYMATNIWIPTHRHKKTGRVYRVLMEGIDENTLADVVIYEAEPGHEFCGKRIWVRPSRQFYDGRFEEIKK